MKTCIFDFDGVIANVNVEKVLLNAQKYSKKFLLPPDVIIEDYFYNNPQNEALDLGLTTNYEVRENIRKKLWDGEHMTWHNWWNEIYNFYEVPQNIEILLKQLKAYGFRLVLLTDNHIGFRKWFEEQFDIHRHFDLIICSAEMGIKKPSAKIFELIAQKMDCCFEEISYFDDDLKNIEQANLLGINGIHFISRKQKITLTNGRVEII